MSQPLKYHQVPWNTADIGMDEIDAVQRVLERKWVTQGPEVEAFEREVGDYVTGVPEYQIGLAMVNGTCALMAALKAHGVGFGDFVVVPSFTYVATVNAIRAVGAIPIFCDSDPETFNATPEMVKNAIRQYLGVANQRFKAIMIVDVGGMPCDLEGFEKLAEEQCVPLVEDAAEAFGAEYKGKKVGSFGHTAVFSFGITKPITSIEGAMVMEPDSKRYERLKLLRHQGVSADLTKYAFGWNFRMSDVHAAIGRVQLTKAKTYLSRRARIARTYGMRIKDVDVQKVPDYVTLHPYQIAFVRSKPDPGSAEDPTGNERVSGIHAFLKANGVDCRIPWIPVHMHDSEIASRYDLPGALKCLEVGLMLPTGNAMSLDDLDYVCRVANGEAAV